MGRIKEAFLNNIEWSEDSVDVEHIDEYLIKHKPKPSTKSFKIVDKPSHKPLTHIKNKVK